MSRLIHSAAGILAACVLFVAAPGKAEDEFLASLRLRGGHDSNPTLVRPARGAPLTGVDAVALIARETDRFTLSLSGEGTHTRYRNEAIAPAQGYRLRSNIESKGHAVSLRSAATAGYLSNYETRSFDAEQSLRLRRAEGRLRPFASASLRYQALNEVSPVLGTFLPESQRFLRGSIIPGIALHHATLEVGMSVNLSATRYAEQRDLFGYRRDYECVEPFLFASYTGEKLSVFASLSRLIGDWHDADFSDVRRTMFELTVGYRDRPLELEFSASRHATDTTFPISPISIDTDISGKLTGHMNSATRIALSARMLEREFLDSVFRSTQISYGIEISRDIAENLTLAAELTQLRLRPIIGAPLEATVASLSLTRRYGTDPENKLRAGSKFPPARSSR